jgi:hypothetical protein
MYLLCPRSHVKWSSYLKISSRIRRNGPRIGKTPEKERERECPGGNLDISHTRLSCSHKLVAKPDTVGSTKE